MRPAVRYEADSIQAAGHAPFTSTSSGQTMVEWLLDTSPFVKRGLCGDWPLWFVGWSAGANFLIFLAYAAIAGNLYHSWKAATRGRRLEYDTRAAWVRVLTTLLFAIFIGSCGISHFLNDVVVYTWPAYRLFALWSTWTAAISWAAAVFLFFGAKAHG